MSNIIASQYTDHTESTEYTTFNKVSQDFNNKQNELDKLVEQKPEDKDIKPLNQKIASMGPSFMEALDNYNLTIDKINEINKVADILHKFIEKIYIHNDLEPFEISASIIVNKGVLKGRDFDEAKSIIEQGCSEANKYMIAFVDDNDKSDENSQPYIRDSHNTITVSFVDTTIDSDLPF